MTISQTEIHQNLSTIIWDMYKDAHGVRPRHINFASYSVAELEAMIESLQVEVLASIQREEEEVAADDLKIAALCADQGIDRETYDRWMVAEGMDW